MLLNMIKHHPSKFNIGFYVLLIFMHMFVIILEPGVLNASWAEMGAIDVIGLILVLVTLVASFVITIKAQKITFAKWLSDLSNALREKGKDDK